MAKSYFKTSQVFGDARIRECALKTLNRLFDERYRSGKGLAHVIQEGRLQEFGLLEDRMWIADALLEAYVTTSLSICRDWAEQNATSHGLLKFPYKDVKVNASRALVFSDLFLSLKKLSIVI